MLRPSFCFLVFGLLVACSPQGSTASSDWSQWRPVPLAYAHNFQCWSRGDERLILVFGHGGSGDTVGTYWLNAAIGSAPPPVEAVPFHLRMDSIAISSTTHVPFIMALGHKQAVVGCGHIADVRDTSFRQWAEAGHVKELATGDGVDRETLLSLRPQALFGYPFGQAPGGSIERLGIPVIEVSEYLEDHPLGRAEWLRFFGLMLGEEHKADSLFAGIKERYEAIRVDSSSQDRPTVLFGSVWEGQWWVPPGNSYMARLIEDAGGRYLFADRKGSGNIAVDMETMLTVGREADRWGMIADLDHRPSRTDLTNGDERLEAFRAAQTMQLFVGNSREVDLFGQALLEPDVVLADLRWLMADEPRPRPSPQQVRQPYFKIVAPVPPKPRHSHDAVLRSDQ